MSRGGGKYLTNLVKGRLDQVAPPYLPETKKAKGKDLLVYSSLLQQIFTSPLIDIITLTHRKSLIPTPLGSNYFRIRLMDGFAYKDLEYVGPPSLGNNYFKRTTYFTSPDGRPVHWRPHTPVIRLFGRQLDVISVGGFLQSWSEVYFGPGSPVYQFLNAFVGEFYNCDFVLRKAYTLGAGRLRRAVNAAHNQIIDLSMSSGQTVLGGIIKMLESHESLVLGGIKPTEANLLTGDSENTAKLFFANVCEDMIKQAWLPSLQGWNACYSQAIEDIGNVTLDRPLPVEPPFVMTTAASRAMHSQVIKRVYGEFFLSSLQV